MKIAAVQFTPEFKNVDKNVQHILDHVVNAQSDLVVMPELATSGYFFLSAAEAAPYSHETDSPFIKKLESEAVANNTVVVCGFIENSNGVLYNSAVVVGKGVAKYVYRKTHLFYKEHQVFERGDTGFGVVNIPHLDCNLGVMICYDWRFPESARTLALRGADVIACPSNLVTNIWRMAMPVRALENKVYLAVANRAGTESNDGEEVTFNADSVIYGYNGSVLNQASTTDNMVVVADINPSETRDKSFNDVNDIFKDRRPEIYE